MSIALVLSMMLPIGFSKNDIEAAVLDADYEKTMLWSTSFESADGFRTSTIDDKGYSNVYVSTTSQLKGELSGRVDLTSLSGSAAGNNVEVMSNLFDGDSGTKYLTAVKPSEIIFKLRDGAREVVKSYGITSANDASGRDPKNWVLQGRNSDSEQWTQLDSQSNQTFGLRYQRKNYDLSSNNTAYNQYRLYISENNGEALTQLADLTLATGTIDESVDGIDGMTSTITSGPTSTWNQKSNQGWTGSRSLVCNGTHKGNGHAYSYNVIYDNLNITVSDNTNLRYVIFPAMSNGDDYDFEYTQMHMAVDLKFKDGTYLSDLNAVDQNGNYVNAQAQGESRTLLTNQWNEIYSRIGDVAKGKVIEKVLVVYDMKSHENADWATFKTYFDDIEIYNQDTPIYSHLSDYVNILRGTNDDPNFSRGLTAPIVAVPNGFNFWTPATNAANNKIYTYQNTDSFRYIQVSHEPSYWVGDRGTWQFMINTSKNSNTNDDFGLGTLKSSFSHDNEVAKAHYYKIAFDSNAGDAANSQMELTPTSHGAVVRFTYGSNAANKSVIFDSANAGGGVTYSGNTFTAYSDHTSNGSKRMYIYGEFSETPWGTKVSDRKSIASFNSNTVTMKIATSYISYDQAKKNLELEIGSDSFDTVYNKAQSTWDEQLGIITDVKGATYEQLVTLYSCIYRMYCYPNLMSENTGTNANPVWKYKSPYREDSAEPVEGKIYINNGFWDTYRTAWSAYGLFTPTKATELLNGLVQHYNDQGWVPRWIAPGGTNSMVGTSSDVIFGDAMSKGITFDYENAYKSALRNAATVSNNLTNGGRNKLNVSNFIGYAPVANDRETFSWSIEGYINDYGIAQMAKSLANNTTDATKKANYLSEYYYYLNRAKNYTLLFDNSGQDVTTKWLRGLYEDGTFNLANSNDKNSFDPFWWGDDYTETNAYNMAVSVPQDGIGIANLYGGREQLADKLDTIFTTNGVYSGYGALNSVGGIHEQKEAREVKLGQYGHSNQPAHHIPYMYLYSSRPWETQKYVRDVLARCYVGGTFGQGYIGDEDNGEMSAWYVLSSIGFYPLVMGSDEFAIGSPQFDEVTVNLENGKKLVIKANNNSKENVYVDSMYVNGEEYNESFIKSDVLAKGGTIEFNMSSTPNKSRGSSTEELEKITTGDNNPQVYKDLSDKADKSASTGVTTLNNLFDNNSDTETRVDNTTTLMFSFNEKVGVRMLTLTSGSGRTPDKAQIYGDNGDGNWQLLGEYNDGNTLYFNAWGKYTRPFAISADKVAEYSRYRVVLTGTDAYLAEVELLGYEGDSIYKSDLASALEIAENVDTGDLKNVILKELENTVSYAKSVYNDAMATDDNIKSAYQKIEEIVDLSLGEVKYRDASHIEAEDFDDKDAVVVNDGSNIGGVMRNTWVKYDSVYFNGTAKNVTFNYAGQSSDAGGYAEIYLDDRAGAPVATIELPTTGNDWSNYQTVEATLNTTVTGLHNVYVVFENDDTHTYVANVDWIEFDSNSADVTVVDEVKVEGFQISYVLEGLRTVLSVEPEINGQKVLEFGNIYALVRDDVTTADMVIGSESPYVAAYTATEKGILDRNYSESDTAINYVMTMTNNGATVEALQQNYMIRGYAKLEDGSYVYSDVSSYSIFNVAKLLYDNGKMSNAVGHDYLYNNILKVVDNSYAEIEFNWNNSIIKP